MRHYTQGRAALNRQAATARRDFLAEFTHCWFCSNFARDCHEIVKGIAGRPLALADRRTWAAACGVCNCGQLNDYSEWPIARQLAVKLINDPEYFDLTLINAMRGRAPTAITLRDVVQYLEVVG